MATRTVKVCDECGKQSTGTDSWLVMEGISVRSAKTGKCVVNSDTSVDLCSPGCLLRYLSKRLEPLMTDRLDIDQNEPYVPVQGGNGRKAA